MLNVFLLLSDLQWFSEGFDGIGRDRRHYLKLTCLFGMVSFTVLLGPSNYQLLWRCHHNLFWGQTQGADLGGQSRHGSDFPTSALQIHDFDPIGVKPWRQLVWDGPQRKTEQSCTYACSKLKAKS